MSYDTRGRLVLDEQCKPNTKQILVPPDGRLALRLLAIRNPEVWGPHTTPDDLSPDTAPAPPREATQEISVAAALALLRDNVGLSDLLHSEPLFPAPAAVVVEVTTIESGSLDSVEAIEVEATRVPEGRGGFPADSHRK